MLSPQGPAPLRLLLLCAGLALANNSALLLAQTAATDPVLPPPASHPDAFAAKSIIAPTPPMGWNSWDNFGIDINEAEFKRQVDYVAAQLRPLGYTYVVIDAGWYAPQLSANRTSKNYHRRFIKYHTNVDDYGRWIPAANMFPSAADGTFRALANYVHGKGLKFGLHIQRGIPWSAIERNLPIKGTPYHARDIANPADACEWWDATLGVDMKKPGAQEYYDSCYEQYASWGVDFVKVDDISRPYHADEIAAIRASIEKTGRPILYSLSPGNTPVAVRYHVQANSDMWRISDDFWDTWPQLKEQFALASLWLRFQTPGHWADLDMLPVGTVGTRCGASGAGRRSRFTPDELRTLMTLWCMFRSPLILGGDLTSMTEFETSLITNRELLDIDQNSEHCREVSANSEVVIYLAEQPTRHRKYLAFFNLSDASRRISCPRAALELPGRVRARDVWNGKDIGLIDDALSDEVPAHGTALFALEQP